MLLFNNGYFVLNTSFRLDWFLTWFNKVFTRKKSSQFRELPKQYKLTCLANIEIVFENIGLSGRNLSESNLKKEYFIQSERSIRCSLMGVVLRVYTIREILFVKSIRDRILKVACRGAFTVNTVAT
jgi:hypothetical protein